MVLILTGVVWFAGGRKEGFSSCCVRTHLALARPAQEWVETLQILSVCIWVEAGQRVCQSISLWACRVSWHWFV